MMLAAQVCRLPWKEQQVHSAPSPLLSMKGSHLSHWRLVSSRWGARPHIARFLSSRDRKLEHPVENWNEERDSVSRAYPWVWKLSEKGKLPLWLVSVAILTPEGSWGAERDTPSIAARQYRKTVSTCQNLLKEDISWEWGFWYLYITPWKFFIPVMGSLTHYPRPLSLLKSLETFLDLDA
jgi:hypothetical protein